MQALFETLNRRHGLQENRHLKTRLLQVWRYREQQQAAATTAGSNYHKVMTFPIVLDTPILAKDLITEHNKTLQNIKKLRETHESIFL